MKGDASGLLARLGEFVVHAAPPPSARDRARNALIDTVGVTLAGAREPAGRIVQETIAEDGGSACTVLGATAKASATGAALANGTAAHALDFDDMCFVSLAHPSAPLVSSALAAAELAGAPGAELLDAYVVGFEIEVRLGLALNPRHYQRGWHCTSTLGTIGAAAAACRLLGLDAAATGHALAIAASEASGLKENFGSMVKPLHAGLAGRNGVLAAQLARRGMTAAARAIDGPQGFLAAMDAEQPTLDLADLGTRWDIVDNGITVKLYPSCAGTHPTLDAVLDLRRRDGFTAATVDAVDVVVDSITPTVLIYPAPANGLEAKFSMPFCVAAAVVHGQVGIASFEAEGMADANVAALMPRVAMRVDTALDGIGRPLTEARVTVRLTDGRTLTQAAHGARGYPERPPSDADLDAKFMGGATRAIPEAAARRALSMLRGIDRVDNVRDLTALLRP